MRVALTAVVMLTACGEPVAQFCTGLTSSICERQKLCGVAASDAPCDDITNNSRAASLPCDQPLLDAVEAGRVRYDGVQASRCLDVLSTQCNPGDACERVFTGTLAIGAACHTSLECGADGWCDSSNVCPGVCAARAGDGAVVSQFDACSTKSRVFQSDGGIRCVESHAAGSPCTENIQCESDLTCRGGQCAAAPTEGQPCDDSRCAIGLARRTNGFARMFARIRS